MARVWTSSVVLCLFPCHYVVSILLDADVEELAGDDSLSVNTHTTPVQSLIVQPSINRKKFDKGKHYSQYKQDEWVDQVLEGRKNLFVVESGANDPISLSNSLFFEISREWDCLLVEANPYLQPALENSNRGCTLFKGGLSVASTPSTFDFKLAGPLGGLVKNLSEKHIARQDREIASKMTWMAGEQGSGKIVPVQCYPLHDILHAMNRTVVDYWSLDTEGSEADIVRSTRFDKITVGVITVEHNGEERRRSDIFRTLTENGFRRVSGDHDTDDYFVNIQYFKERGIPLPK